MIHAEMTPEGTSCVCDMKGTGDKILLELIVATKRVVMELGRDLEERIDMAWQIAECVKSELTGHALIVEKVKEGCDGEVS